MEIKKMTGLSIDDFLEELSSAKPVPGGGGASAVSAALGAALSNMVLHLTEGKKKYAGYQDEMISMIERLNGLIKDLSMGADKDAEAFEPLSRAYGLKKDTPEEQEYRDKVMGEALKTASEAPLELMENILKAAERVSEIGSVLAISDAGAAAQLLNASMKAASLNVFINTGLMKDKDEASGMNEKAMKLIMECDGCCTRAYDRVLSRIGVGL